MIGQPAGIAEAKRQIQDIINSSMSGDRYGGGGQGGPPRGGGYGSGDYGMGGGGGGGYGRGGNSQTIQIPSTKVGLVIGRGGETIRDLQDRSGARIAVTPTPHDHTSDMRTVTITGDDHAIQQAKGFIEEIVNDTAPRGGYGGGGGGYQSSPPVTMTVPQETIGLVIGRGGETVKALQLQSRAKIQVQQVDPSVPPPAERTINLFGPPEAIEYAKQLIMEKVNGAVSDSFHIYTIYWGMSLFFFWSWRCDLKKSTGWNYSAYKSGFEFFIFFSFTLCLHMHGLFFTPAFLYTAGTSVTQRCHLRIIQEHRNETRMSAVTKRSYEILPPNMSTHYLDHTTRPYYARDAFYLLTPHGDGYHKVVYVTWLSFAIM